MKKSAILIVLLSAVPAVKAGEIEDLKKSAADLFAGAALSLPEVPAAALAEEAPVMAGAGDVIITVDRFTAPNAAPMVFALCDSERCHKLQDKGYKDIKAELLETVPSKRIYLLRGLKPGEYSLSGYNDVNGNGRLDTGLFGIPKEPVGFSVLNTTKLGSNPRWDSVRFTVDSAAVSVCFHLIHKFGR